MRWYALRHGWRAWAWWERFTSWLIPVTPIADGSILTVHLRREVLELHVDNRELERFRRTGGSAFAMARELRAELSTLAARIRGGEFSGVRMLWARSLIGEAGGMFGFQTRVLPRTFTNSVHQFVLVGLDAIHHPDGVRVHSANRWPVETTMTVEELLVRYPAKSERSTLAR